MTPRKGDKVRVTYEAVYVEQIPSFGSSFGSTRHILRVDASDRRSEYSAPPDATLEVLEDLRSGDIYRTEPDEGVKQAHVVAYLNPGQREPWYCLSCRQWARDSFVPRPLTLLVRDGKPVTP